MKKDTIKRGFFYPQYSVTINAETQEDADKEIERLYGKAMDESKVDNKGIPGRVSNK